MNGPPPLTDEQRRQALIKAAEARRVRAQIKELLKVGSLSLEDLLERSDTDENIGRMKVLSVYIKGTGYVRETALRDLQSR